MSVELTGVVVDCRDPELVAAFWSDVLGYPYQADGGFAWLEVPAGALTVAFQQVSEEKRSKNRWHPDLTPGDASQEDELDRLLSIGASRIDVGQSEDVSWIVLADPEGNEFCLLAGEG